MSVETPDYAAMLERMVKAYGKRVGAGDPVDLTRMAEVQAVFDAAVQAAVDGQRAAGYSWREVGEGLGMSKQAAQQRFGKATEAAEAMSVVAS